MSMCTKSSATHSFIRKYSDILVYIYTTLYICVYVYVYLYMCICICVYVYVQHRTYTHVYIRAVQLPRVLSPALRIHTSTIYKYNHIHIYIYTYIYTHIHMYMCVYIYTCMYWQFYSPGSYVFINLFIHKNLWTGLPNNHQWSQRKFRYICTAYGCCLQWHFFNLKSQSMI